MAERQAPGQATPAADETAVAARWGVIACVLLIVVLLSSFAVIYSAHRTRELFRELEQQRHLENEAQIEWRQLLIERSTQASHARVEEIARDTLQMRPVGDEFRMVVVE